MLANGVQMKEIQEWLGHADFGTTADVGNRHTYKIEFKAIKQQEFMQFLYNS